MCRFAALCSSVYVQCVSMYMGVCFLVHVCIPYVFLCCVFVSDNECMSVFMVCVCVCVCVCMHESICMCMSLLS